MSTDGYQVLAGIVSLDDSGQRASDRGAALNQHLRAIVQLVVPSTMVLLEVEAVVRPVTIDLAAVLPPPTDLVDYDLEVAVDMSQIDSSEMAAEAWPNLVSYEVRAWHPLVGALRHHGPSHGSGANWELDSNRDMNAGNFKLNSTISTGERLSSENLRLVGPAMSGI